MTTRKPTTTKSAARTVPYSRPPEPMAHPAVHIAPPNRRTAEPSLPATFGSMNIPNALAATSRPPLTVRAQAVAAAARVVIRAEQRVVKTRADAAQAVALLKEAKKMMTSLLADESTYGPDGKNKGELS